MSLAEMSVNTQRLSSLAARLGQLQAGWPAIVRLDIVAAPSIYDYHPYLFVGAFAPIEDDRVESLALAARLFANFAFLSDGTIDGVAEPGFGSIAPLRGSAMQFETYRILHELFPTGSSFWPRFGGYLRDLAEGCVAEAEFGSGRRSWSEFTEEVARSIAIKKAAIAKASVAGLAALADDDSPVTALVAAIDHYNVGYQWLDDLGDWKKDLRGRQPSLLLARLVPEVGPFQTAEPDPEVVGRIARELYYGGHASYILALAALELDQAERALAPLPPIPAGEAIVGLKRRCLTLEADIARIVADNTRRVRTQPEVRLAPPRVDGRPWLPLAWKALDHTVAEWRRGFGEARHLMRFAWDQGFSGASEIQSGDVFQRSLLTEALLEAAELVGGALKPAIDHEIGYLLGRCVAEPPGGWSYFPDLPELPPDADDLAQVMRVLLLADQRQEAARLCEPALGVLLRDGAHPDGSLETWIVPAEPILPAHQRQARFVQLAWGTGPDPEVMANLLLTLHLYDASRFARELQRGIDFVEHEQESDGSWSSTWYHGPFYGVLAGLRLLAAARPGSPAIAAAVEFLRRTQQPGGGWGVQGAPDALSTGLALLAMATAPDSASRTGDRERATRGRDFLDSVHRPDDGWRGCPFIQMALGRAPGGPVQTIYYTSRTVTTAFVLRAALAWDRKEVAERC